MIPAAIQSLLPQHPGEENRIGHSGAQVVMYEDYVQKRLNRRTREMRRMRASCCGF